MKYLFSAATASLTLALYATVATAEGTAPVQPAPAATPAVAPGTRVAAAKEAGNPDQIICKSVETTGSHLGGSRVCRTRATWDEMARAAREDTSRFQNSDSGTNIPH